MKNICKKTLEIRKPKVSKNKIEQRDAFLILVQI